MTPPRVLLMSKPPRAVLARAVAAVRQAGLDRRLGAAMFEAGNWHQTWSGRYADTPEMRSRLRQVGGSVSAQAFTLPFNRIDGSDHWAMLGRGRPAGFKALLGSVRATLSAHDLDAPGHTPHMTISYRAPEPLGAAIAIPVIEWPVEDILLVGGGKHYHYEVIDGWPLRPPPDDPQLRLF